MSDNVISWKQPPLSSSNPNLKTTQKYNNILRKQIEQELTKIRQGNPRPGLSENAQGNLVCVDSEGERRVVALEDRNEVIGAAWRKYGHVGLARLHSLLSRAWCNISKRKVERWYQNSEINQLHSKVFNKTVVRPVWASTVLRHVQVDLTDWSSRPCSKGKFVWILSCIDVYSKYAVCVPMRNKEAATTANAMRLIIQRLHLDMFGSVVQADNGSEFKGAFKEMVVNEFGLKLIHGKSYTSTHAGLVERFQQSLRRALSKYMSQSGKSDWSSQIENTVFAYNSSGHSTIGNLEPAVALHKSLQGDSDVIQYVRMKNFETARKRLGREGDYLEPGQRVRVSIYAISSAARKQLKSGTTKGRKNSMTQNYTRTLFTISHRSKGTPLQHSQYRLKQIRGIFWRTELLPVNVDELRKDAAQKPPPRDTMAGLEDKAIAELTNEQAVIMDGDVDAGSTSKSIEPEVKRWIGVSINKEFKDGMFTGKVIGHVPDLDDDEIEDSERWVIKYDKTKFKESIDSQELLMILTGETDTKEKEKTENSSTKDDAPNPKPKPKPKPPQPKTTDPLLGRRVKSEDTDSKGKVFISALGTISRVIKRKGKSKQYVIEWDNSEYDEIKVGYARVKTMLMPMETGK